jgi:ABC-type bacteriocin/lantibiotic exporter with double-glycine peptidase domain
VRRAFILATLLLAATTALAAPARPARMPSAFIEGLGFSFQTFNNCGPAALSGILAYYGIKKSQDEVRTVLRPGNGYMRADVIDPYLRPLGLRASRFTNGNLNAIKRLVGQGIPVIVLQWLDRPGHIMHFRVVRGYDDKQAVVWVSDSMYGGTAYLKYTDFDLLWTQTPREMIPVYPTGYEKTVAQLVGVNVAL